MEKESIERRHSAWKTCGFGACLAWSLLTLPSSGWAACKLQSLELPATMVGFRAMTTLGINGTEVPLMVDSGAFFSFLTHAAAQQLGLKVGPLPWGLRIEGLTGGVDAGKTTVKHLQLRSGELPNVDFIVGGNDEGDGSMGLLGRNILAIADTEYDLAHGVIRLVFPNDECSKTMMAYWAGDKPVSELALLSANSTTIPTIEAYARINGKEVRVMFDTGAQSLVSLSAAKRAGVKDMEPAGMVHGGGRGAVKAWTANVAKLELGGETISNIRLAVADFDIGDIEMLVGVDFFLSHRIYVSKKQRRMYLTYNGGPVFTLSAIEMAKAAAKTPAPANAASAPSVADADAPADAAGYARRGAASAARLDFAGALADLDHACEMAPQVAEYFVRRGAVHEMLEQRQPALQDFDKALQLEPAQAEARLRRGWLRVAADDRDGALDDLQVLNKNLAPQASQRLQLAAMYESLDVLDLALSQWNAWIDSHPKDVELAGALNNRCWSRTMLNIELDQALDDCDRAVDLQPERASRYDSRAWLRLRRNELRKARADFDHSLKLRPASSTSLYGRGIVRRKQGELEAGQTDIEAARKLDASIDKRLGRHGLAADPEASPSPKTEPETH